MQPFQSVGRRVYEIVVGVGSPHLPPMYRPLHLSFWVASRLLQKIHTAQTFSLSGDRCAP